MRNHLLLSRTLNNTERILTAANLRASPASIPALSFASLLVERQGKQRRKSLQRSWDTFRIRRSSIFKHFILFYFFFSVVKLGLDINAGLWSFCLSFYGKTSSSYLTSRELFPTSVGKLRNNSEGQLINCSRVCCTYFSESWPTY